MIFTEDKTHRDCNLNVATTLTNNFPHSSDIQRSMTLTYTYMVIECLYKLYDINRY
jgi:hypothetical protein